MSWVGDIPSCLQHLLRLFSSLAALHVTLYLFVTMHVVLYLLGAMHVVLHLRVIRWAVPSPISNGTPDDECICNSFANAP